LPLRLSMGMNLDVGKILPDRYQPVGFTEKRDREIVVNPGGSEPDKKEKETWTIGTVE
jgi:hypothetical protein